MSNPFWIGTWFAIAVALCPEPAIAKPRRPETPRKVCEKTYADARKLEGDGKLSAAEELLKKCAVPTCGAFLEHQCTARYAVIDADIPSVVPVAVDGKGEPVVDVEVTMDDQPLVDHLDGRSSRVDPGLHRFTFKHDGQVLPRSVLVAQGQRNLRIEVTLGPKGRPTLKATPEKHAPVELVNADRATPPPAKADVGEPPALRADPPAPARGFERRHPSAVPSYLMLTTGVIGIGGYGVLTYWGRTDNNKLADCTPDCLPASVEHVKKLYLAANISLGVGVVALVTGVLLRWRSHSTYQVEVQAKNGGGLATVSRAF